MDITLNFTEEGFVGHIKMRVATNIARLKIMDALGIDIVAVDGKEAIKKQLSQLKTVIGLLESSEEYFILVDLKRDGKEYKSFTDLDADPKMQRIMMKCATSAIISLGETQKK